MPKQVALLLADGFEEAEAIIIYDVLCRLKIDVQLIACNGQDYVQSYHQINLQPHAQLHEVQSRLYDAVVLPGGLDGTLNLAANPAVIRFIEQHDQAGKYLGAICSAAARVLSANQLLKGRRYVCSGGLQTQVNDGCFVDRAVVEDGNLITGKGLGLAFDFAATLAARLTQNPAEVDFQIEHIDYDHWRSKQLNNQHQPIKA